jgi:hypothetical protein
MFMGKAKAKQGKGGTGRGTGKKGWTRWQTSAKKAKVKPYKSKSVKNHDTTTSSDLSEE